MFVDLSALLGTTGKNKVFHFHESARMLAEKCFGETNTQNEVALGPSHVRHAMYLIPLFACVIPTFHLFSSLAVKIQFSSLSEYKLHIKRRTARYGCLCSNGNDN